MSEPTNPKAGLYSKFLAALNELPDMVKDATGQTGNRQYQYMTLNTLLGNIRKPFADNRIGLYQNVRYDHDCPTGPLMVVDTIIFDGDTGETQIVGSYPVVLSPDSQKSGSAVTYARRYALFAVLGIYPDKDDDGASTVNGAQPPAQRQNDPWERKPPAQRQNGISEKAANDLAQLARQNGVDLIALASRLKGHKVSRLRELTYEDGKALTAEITNMVKAQQQPVAQQPNQATTGGQQNAQAK